MVISSIFCHYIAGYGGRGAKHNEDCHEFLISVAEKDGKREEKSRQQDKLDERSKEGRLYFFDGLSSLKTGSNGDQCQWGGSGADTADGFVQECRKPESGKDKEQGDEDAQENRIFEYIKDRFSYIRRGVILSFQSQDQHGKNVIERNSANDHQGSHTSVVVHVVDESKSEDGGAAAIGCLNESAFLEIIFHKKLC